MMNERVTVFSFAHPLPHRMRQSDWPQCGKCCASFYLHEGTEVAGPAAVTPSSSSAPPVLPAASDLVAGLTNLAGLLQAGFLTLAEFQAAKQQLLAA